MTSRRPLAAILVALAVAVSACGAGPATDKDKIAKATSTYLRALSHGDAARACSQLSPHARGDRCRQAVAQRLSQLNPDVLADAADASLDIAVNGRTAVATLGAPRGAHLTLVKVGAAWLIDSGYTLGSPIAGGLVPIGPARSLYLNCVGDGRPTVVVEAGFPGTSDVWRDVQPALGRTTRTCAYDRAGLGNSPPTAGVRDAGDEIDDL